MKKREKKLCALLLGITMLCSGLPTGMLHVPAAETGTQKSAGQSYTKTKNVTVVDTLAGGKGSEWFNENDGVTFSDGNLNVYDDNNSAASVMRNIGNGDFTAEIHWSDFKASASGNSGVMMLRIRADKDSEDDLVEIDRFSDGNLKLLVKSKTKPVVNNVVTSSNFNANEGWFKISYKSSTKMVTAEYKVSESDSYQTMTSGQAAMDNFGGTHILEVRAQAWNGNVSANIKQVNSTFVKTADYKYHETEEYVNPKQPDLWYGGEGAEYVQGTGFRLTGTDNGIARVKRDIGDQDLSAEIKWGGSRNDSCLGRRICH